MKGFLALLVTFLVSVSFIRAGDGESSKVPSWSPNTEKLDLAAKFDDSGVTLARYVKRFYQLLRDKRWLETYELRAKAFRNDFSEADYLEKARTSEKTWGLVNYDVLSVKFSNSLGSTDVDEAVLICRFVELPEYATSYSTVFWHKENGVWRCLSAGPVKLDIFQATRPTLIDWR
jgi:hypothetical protein